MLPPAEEIFTEISKNFTIHWNRIDRCKAHQNPLRAELRQPIQRDYKRWTLLQNWLLPQMSEDSEDFIFQQDGAPPHWHRDVRRFLNESLPQRWIGRVGN
jgi:hypothetical protein